MPTERITADLVKAMQVGDVLWDNEVRGFGVRHRARDRIYLLKVRVRGKQRVLTIGRHGRGAFGPESARREAQRLVGLIRDGQDPATERDKERSSPTVALFAERFTREYSAVHHKPRSQAEAKGLIREHARKGRGNQGDGFRQAVNGHERPESRPLILAEQHLV